jgi:epoxyqueuosine reductase
MHTLKITHNPEKLKEGIRDMVLKAGFVRCRFLAPFIPRESVPAQYRNAAPALLVAALAYAKSPLVGNIAPFAQRNYYRAGVQRLQALAKECRARWGGVKSDFRILCNSPVPEKSLAVACGLGVFGRNSLVITPEAGSRVILAAMTLPYSLPGDSPHGDGKNFPFCKNCDPILPPCAAACPTKSADGNGSLHLSRCIQWYASGKGASVPQEVARNWGNRLYGCTPCQDACVHNQQNAAEFFTENGSLPAYIDPAEILAMPDEAIRSRFQGTVLGMAWLGPQGIRRNAALNLAYLQDVHGGVSADFFSRYSSSSQLSPMPKK